MKPEKWLSEEKGNKTLAEHFTELRLCADLGEVLV